MSAAKSCTLFEMRSAAVQILTVNDHIAHMHGDAKSQLVLVIDSLISLQHLHLVLRQPLQPRFEIPSKKNRLQC